EKSRKPRVMDWPDNTIRTKVARLQSRQIMMVSRLVVARSNPKIDIANGIAELRSKIRRRNLSSFDHSWTEPLRNATTTPANPASVTAICALALKASLGCISDKIRLHPFLNQTRIHVKPIH